MARFVTTIQFTDRGVGAIRETCRRANEFRERSRTLGVEIVDLYWTLGAQDGVIVFDAPDEETATAVMLDLASRESVRPVTSRAFTAEEIEGILNKLD